MSAADQVLSRLHRVKQSRPGQWMSACPCCESRKGRPLAITETNDGRVLMYAFCGCSTEDVLGRIGLTINDLFNEPLTHVQPDQPRVPAMDLLNALSMEASVLAVIASDIKDHAVVSDEDWDRLATCAQRIATVRDYINERNR